MAAIQRRDTAAGVRYVVRHRSPDGTERSRTFTRRADALAHKATLEFGILSGEYADPRKGRAVSFAVAVGKWQDARIDIRASTRTQEASLIRTHVLPAFGDTPIGAIETTDVRAWVAALSAEGLSASTVRQCYRIVAAVFTMAVDDGVIARSPCRGIKLPAKSAEPMRFLDADELFRLVETAGEFWGPLILTAGFTGMRWGELAGLRVDRLDVLGRSITVAEQLTEVGGRLSFGPPKTAKSHRRIAIPGFVAETIGEHMGRFPNDQGMVFASPEGKLLRRSSFRRIWTRAIDAADVAPLRFHDLRHTHVALLIGEGEHVKVIAERLGHASPLVTMNTYAHLLPGLDADAADRLEDRYRGMNAGWDSPGGEVKPLRGLGT